MNSRLEVLTKQPIEPLLKNGYRILALLLEKDIYFGSGEENCLICGGQKIVLKETEDNKKAGIYTGAFRDKGYSFYADGDLDITEINGSCLINRDIYRCSFEKIYMQAERSSLKRDPSGLYLGKESDVCRSGEDKLLIDVFLNLLEFTQEALGIEVGKEAKLPRYSVLVSFDVDGYLEGQIDGVLQFLTDWNIIKPTFMIMTPSEEEKTIYDPLYWLGGPEIRKLYTGDYEIGLHASYLANDNLAMLKNQKTRLEQACGQAVEGVRSHYLRYHFPATWGSAMECGFSYDASVGYSDLAGYRNGTGLPFPVYHPSGYDQKLWFLSTMILDQTLFMGNKGLDWGSGERNNLDTFLEHAKEQNGTILLDWHVHGYNAPQFPTHFDALKHILNKAQEDGAAITGIYEYIKPFSRLWDERFAGRLEFTKLCRKISALREMPIEIIPYKELLKEKNTFKSSTENAADSFAGVFPRDAETILDIGGEDQASFSSRVPLFYRFSCVNKSEDALRRSNRQGFVGTVTDLPFVSQSVDFIIVHGILEKLSLPDRKEAFCELDRVGKKYLYLQLPYDDMTEGIIKCDSCGECWQYDFHRDALTLEKVEEIIPDGWKIKDVIFTGEVSYRHYTELKDNLSNGLQSPNGVCPYCGNIIATEKPAFFNDVSLASYSDQEQFPKYGKLAVLLVKEKEERRITAEWKSEIKGWWTLNMNTIDFSQPFLQMENCDYNQCIPYIRPYHIHIRKLNNSILCMSGSSGDAYLDVCFPWTAKKGDRLLIKGSGKGAFTATINFFNILMQEMYGMQVHEKPGDFSVIVDIPSESWGLKAYLRIYIEEKQQSFQLYSIGNISRTGREYYAYQGGKRKASLKVERNGILYHFAMPDKEVLFTDILLDMN